MHAPAGACSAACTVEPAPEPRLAVAMAHGSGHQLGPHKSTPCDTVCTRALLRYLRGSLSRGSADSARDRRRSLHQLSELVAPQGALHFSAAPAAHVRAGSVREQLSIPFHVRVPGGGRGEWLCAGKQHAPWDGPAVRVTSASAGSPRGRRTSAQRRPAVILRAWSTRVPAPAKVRGRHLAERLPARTRSRGWGKTTQLAAPRARHARTRRSTSCRPIRRRWNAGATATSHTDAANAPSDTALPSRPALGQKGGRSPAAAAAAGRPR